LWVFALAFAQLATPASIEAQSTPKLAVSAGAGLSNPFHGDFDFTAPEWHVGLRATVAEHFVIEGFFEQWRHTSDEVFAPVTTRTVHDTKVVGFNALVRAAFDRVTLTAGGGPSSLVYNRRFTQTRTDCDSTSSASCREFENRFSNNSFSVQGVAGLEVAITSFVAAFGQVQFVIPTVDVAGGHSTVVGGVRLRVW
jgi:hypothetical protein